MAKVTHNKENNENGTNTHQPYLSAYYFSSYQDLSPKTDPHGIKKSCVALDGALRGMITKKGSYTEQTGCRTKFNSNRLLLIYLLF